MHRKGVRAVAIGAAAALLAGLLAGGASASTRSGKKPSGEPILIGALGPFDVPNPPAKTTEWPAAVKARAKAINAAGGIGGRPVKVFVCNTALDPNQTETCVRDAADAGVVATVGWNGTTGANYFPLLQQEGIAAIGSVPVGLDEVTNPVSFPFTSGVPGAFEGLPIAIGDQGADTQALVLTDLGAPAALAQLLVETSAERQGYDLLQSIKAAPDQTDFAPIVAAATSGDPQGISVFIIGDAAATFIKTLRQGGYTGKVSSGSPFITEGIIEALGDDANGIIVVSLLRWQGSKNGRLFAHDMRTYAKGEALTDLSANYWLSTWVFEQVAKKIAAGGGTVDKTSVLDAMGQLSNFSTGGMTPPITTTAPVTVESPIPLQRFFNPTVVNFRIKNGKLRLVNGKFINPFEEQ
jgi:branched-chain amino acid transport system substrate-binding protein